MQASRVWNFTYNIKPPALSFSRLCPKKKYLMLLAVLNLEYNLETQEITFKASFGCPYLVYVPYIRIVA